MVPQTFAGEDGGRGPWPRRLVPLAAGTACVLLSAQLPLGTATRPGPGLWPLLCGLLTVGAAVLAWRTPPAEGEQRFSRQSVWPLLAAVSLVGFTVAMPLVGFEVALAVLLAVWLKLLGGEGWVLSVAVALSSTAALYLLFVTALGVQIPRLF